MVLETVDLAKQYGKQFAVSELNMHVKKGEIYGLLGRNGAGKTTTIRMAMGLLQPTKGEVKLFGERLTVPTKQIFNRIGALIESPAFYENLTAKDNLKIIADLRGTQSRDCIDRALMLVNLENETHKKVKQFSLGMKQRLGIAMALMHEPEFIILDEPTNGLDPVGIQQIRLLIQKLCAEKGTTILISSHILEELVKIATHYGFLDNGSLLREMSAEELAAECRKSVRLTISNSQAFVNVMEQRKIEYKLLDEETAEVFGEISISELVLELTGNGCEVRSMQEHDENLESFYLSLIGGKGHA